MSQEQNMDFITLWDTVAFDGKESFTLSEDGKLLLNAGKDGKERLIAEFSAENSTSLVDELREKYAQLEAKVAETAAEWDASEDKLKMADKVHTLKQQLNNAAALGNLDALLAKVAVWEQAITAIHDEHYAVKLKLAEQAESLAESTDWKETANVLKEIAEQWKQSGHTDKYRSDKLWSRIEAARKNFNDRKQKHFEEQEKDLLGNLDLKLDLVEQAESLVNSVEWKKTSETFHRLTNEWKTIGHTLSKKNEELWQRFIASKAAFFDRKREHSERIAVEQEQSFIAKSALVEKAEALKDSTEWNKTAQAFAALMEEWKKTGRVGGERGDELWARFIGAQDVFYTNKHAHTENIRAMHEENYTLKMEILRRAERIKNSSSWGDATVEMNELLDKWKTIGPVAREHATKIWEDFLAARKHFFARKDENRDLRKQQFEGMKETRKVQAKEMVAKLLTDIQEEEDKIIDFKAALENITPGKKAAELRKHLEQLLQECEKQIKRLKEKYAAVQDEFGKQAEEAAKAIKAAAIAAPEVKAEEAIIAEPATEAVVETVATEVVAGEAIAEPVNEAVATEAEPATATEVVAEATPVVAESALPESNEIVAGTTTPADAATDGTEEGKEA